MDCSQMGSTMRPYPRSLLTGRRDGSGEKISQIRGFSGFLAAFSYSLHYNLPLMCEFTKGC
jgi:hypothetical protein